MGVAMGKNNLKYILFIMAFMALTGLILAILVAPLNFLKFNNAIALFLGIFAMITSLISAFLVLRK